MRPAQPPLAGGCAGVQAFVRNFLRRFRKSGVTLSSERSFYLLVRLSQGPRSVQLKGARSNAQHERATVLMVLPILGKVLQPVRAGENRSRLCGNGLDTTAALSVTRHPVHTNGFGQGRLRRTSPNLGPRAAPLPLPPHGAERIDSSRCGHGQIAIQGGRRTRRCPRPHNRQLQVMLTCALIDVRPTEHCPHCGAPSTLNGTAAQPRTACIALNLATKG